MENWRGRKEGRRSIKKAKAWMRRDALETRSKWGWVRKPMWQNFRNYCCRGKVEPYD